VPQVRTTYKAIFWVVACFGLGCTLISYVAAVLPKGDCHEKTRHPYRPGRYPELTCLGCHQDRHLVGARYDLQVCPITVKRALSKVAGIQNAEVSFEKREAVVAFDDAKTNIEAITKATANAGYPSTLKAENKYPPLAAYICAPSSKKENSDG
jgi:mercuric ion binding protein